MERIKAVFNWSGGKDSAHALLRAMQSGKYEIVALLTTVNRDTHRSTMHGIPTALLQAQADSIGIPLHIVDLTPKGNMEDYGAAMSHAVEHFKAQGVTCSSSGTSSYTTYVNIARGSSHPTASGSRNRSGENPPAA